MLAVNYLLVVNNLSFPLRLPIIMLYDCGIKIGSKSNVKSTCTRSFLHVLTIGKDG